MNRTTMIICAAALAAFGCDKQTTPDPEPAATAAQVGQNDSANAGAASQSTEEPTEKPTENPTAEAAPVKILGTPYDQEHTRVSLVWNSADAAALYRSPGVVSKATAKPGWKQGDEISFDKSWVFVAEPTTVTAKEGARLHDAASYTPATGATAEASRTLDVRAGEVVAIYKIAAEGFCYTGMGDAYYLSGCPQQDTFEGDDAAFAGPKSDAYEWWVHVRPASGEGGWLHVDDNVEVKLTATL